MNMCATLKLILTFSERIMFCLKGFASIIVLIQGKIKKFKKGENDKSRWLYCLFVCLFVL